MNLIPVKIQQPKQILNSNILTTISNSDHKKLRIRSDFVSNDDLEIYNCDKDKLLSKILSYIEDLPHSRLTIHVRNLDDEIEITINPMVSTA